MNATQLKYICSTYGDKSLAENEQWKCIEYFTAATSVNATISVQDYIRRNKIMYTTAYNEPGFLIMDYSPAYDGIVRKNDKLVITFIPLSKILSVSVRSKIKHTDSPDKPTEIHTAIDALDAESGLSDYGFIITTGGADAVVDVIYDGRNANRVLK